MASPLAVGPVKPGLFPGQADQTGSAGGCPGTLDPGRQIVSQDNPNGVSRIGGQAGTQRPLTLRPRQDKAGEAGPEALSTLSLPNMNAYCLIGIRDYGYA